MTPKTLTLEQFKVATKIALLEYSHASTQETTDAFEGKTSDTIETLGMDSLDIVEISMYVEDQLGVGLDDDVLDETFQYDTPIQLVAQILHTAYLAY